MLENQTISPLLSRIPTPEPFAAMFHALEIDSVTYAHPPVFTVEDGKDFEHLIPGGHSKNLFLKDKKSQLWLVTALFDTVINLKRLPNRINAAKLSFGNAGALLETLGVLPGSVTPLGLVNDRERRVRPVLDARLFACDTVNFHPLTNDKTTNIKPADLLRFIKDLGYDPLTVDFRDV